MKQVKTNKRKKSKIITMTLILLLVFIFFFSLLQVYKNIEIDNSNYSAVRSSYTQSEQTVEKESQKSQKIVDMIEKTTQSVVGISKLKNAGSTLLTGTSEEDLGLGSGIIVTDNGYILSNEHVTGSKYSKCYITLEDGQNYEGTVTWSDEDLDLSLTKIKAEGLPYIQLGGPLIYATGEMIGINTVKISSAEGIGFAIPINVIKNVIDSFKKTDSFEEATLGIYAYDGTAVQYLDNVKTSSLATATIIQKGVYVDQITVNGPSSNTELKSGDIITNIDEIELNTVNDLREYIFTKKPGDEVNLKINRGKINKEIKVILGKK